MAKRKLNVRLIRKIQKEITEEPKRFDIGQWGSFYTEKDYDEADSDFIPACGTIACIAGWAAIIEAKRKRGIRKFTDKFVTKTINNLESGEGPIRKGAKLLGLEEGQANRLFLLDGWPHKYRARYLLARDSEDQNAMAQVAVDLLEAVIKNDGTVPA